MYLWGNGLNTEDLCDGGGEPGDKDRLWRLDKGIGGLGACPKAPSGGNRWLVKIGGGGSKSSKESNVKSGETVGNGMSNNSSSKSFDESMLSAKNKRLNSSFKIWKKKQNPRFLLTFCLVNK